MAQGEDPLKADVNQCGRFSNVHLGEPVAENRLLL